MVVARSGCDVVRRANKGSGWGDRCEGDRLGGVALGRGVLWLGGDDTKSSEKKSALRLTVRPASDPYLLEDPPGLLRPFERLDHRGSRCLLCRQDFGLERRRSRRPC